MDIRKYIPEDNERLLKLLQLNIPKYFAVEEAEDYEVYLNSKIEDYFVIEKEGEIIGGGGINYFPEEKTARLSWDLLHPNHHGQGFGKQLVLHRIEYVSNKKGYDILVVRTSQLVYPFYEKSGFRLENISKDYWAEGFDMYYMELYI